MYLKMIKSHLKKLINYTKKNDDEKLYDPNWWSFTQKKGEIRIIIIKIYYNLINMKNYI
jgi:hypothetical protein